jgi:hypothetical protein
MKTKVLLSLAAFAVAGSMLMGVAPATAAPSGGADVARVQMFNSHVATAYWSTCTGDWPPPPGVPCTYTSLSAGVGKTQVAIGSWFGDAPLGLNHISEAWVSMDQETITYPEDSYIYGGSDYSEPLYSSAIFGYTENPTALKIDTRLTSGSLNATLNMLDCTDAYNGLAGECTPLTGTSTVNFKWVGEPSEGNGFCRRCGQPDPPMCNGPNGAFITEGANWNIFHLDLFRRVDATVSGSATGFAPVGTLGGASLMYAKGLGLDIGTGCPVPPPPEITFTNSYTPDDQSGRTGTFAMDYDFAVTPVTTALIARVTHATYTDPNPNNDPDIYDRVVVEEDFEVRVPTPGGVTAGTYHFEVPATVCDGDPNTGDDVTVHVFHDIKGNTDWFFNSGDGTGGTYYYARESGGTCTLNGPF